MSLILNIDTSGEIAYISIAKNGIVLDEAYNTKQNEHSTFLESAIKQIAEKLNISLSELDGIAVSIGPGSYTGLRIGMSSAKSLSYTLNKPMIGIDSLTILTQSALSAINPNDDILLCPMIDARRMEVYTAIFNQNLSTYMEPCAMILNESSFQEILAAKKVLFFGNGSFKWQQICSNRNASFESVTINSTALSMLSFKYFKNDKFINTAYSEPFYIKEFNF